MKCNTITLCYEASPFLSIKSVSIIGTITKGIENCVFIKDAQNWILHLELPPGAYHYKFLINDFLLLNDVTANLYEVDGNNELWSVLIIDKNQKRLYNTKQYFVHINQFHLSSFKSKQPPISNKTNYNLSMDSRVVSRIEFGKITGIHTLTAIWFTPENYIFEATEQILYPLEINVADPYIIWFWMELNPSVKNYSLGRWSLKLFIDGSYIFQTSFLLDNSCTYSLQQLGRRA